MSGTSGRTSRPPFAYYDPDSLSWKTYDITFFSDSPKFSGTLPTSGSMRNGRLSERPMSALATSDPACSLLLPTPAAQEPGGTVERHLESKNKFDGANRTRPTHLALAVKLLPTPTASDASQSGNRNLPGSKAHDGVSLTDAVVRGKYLPTPTARLGDERGAQAKRYENPDRSNDLDDAVAWMKNHLLPTPTRRDSKGPNQRNDETCLHGAISGLRSDDTNGSSDDMLQRPPTTRDDSILDSWNF